jgi:hypothetical protein
MSAKLRKALLTACDYLEQANSIISEYDSANDEDDGPNITQQIASWRALAGKPVKIKRKRKPRR